MTTKDKKALEEQLNNVNTDLKVLEERVEGERQQISGNKEDIHKLREYVDLIKDNERDVKILESKIGLYLKTITGVITIIASILAYLGHGYINKSIEEVLASKAEQVLESKIDTLIDKEQIVAKIKEKGDTAISGLMIKLHDEAQNLSKSMKEVIEHEGKKELKKELDKAVSEFEDAREKFINKLDSEIDSVRLVALATINNLKEVSTVKSDIFPDEGMNLSDSVVQQLNEFTDILREIAPDEYTYDDWFYKGWDDYSKGNYEEAVSSWNKAAEKDKNDPSVYYNRGLAYNQLNDNNKAMADFNTAIELNPDNALYYLERGTIYIIIENFDKAISDLNQAIKLDENNKMAYAYRGYAHFGNQDYNKAIDDFSEAIVSGAELSFNYFMRGLAYFQKDTLGVAIIDFNKVIELNPNDEEAYYYRGLIYHNEGQYAKAENDYNKALELDPDHIDVLENLVELKIMKGDYRGALNKVQKILSLKAEIGDKALCYYFECITKKLLNEDPTNSEQKLNNLLGKNQNITIDWSFKEIENWLNTATINSKTKQYISTKTNLMKQYVLE